MQQNTNDPIEQEIDRWLLRDWARRLNTIDHEIITPQTAALRQQLIAARDAYMNLMIAARFEPLPDRDVDTRGNEPL